jgi:ABC-2 type transport system ATP-binding protein
VALAFSVSSLSKHYRPWFGASQEALRSLNLSVERGVAFGLIGPNGAGKTTFIKLLLGVLRASSGDVSVLQGHPQDLAVRARIGYLPERMFLPAALRAEDFLRSVATFKDLRLTQTELSGLLERVGLASSRKRIGEFSKGMRQRLGLAAAMLGTPDLLILDEPTDGIDPVGRVEMRALLLEEKRRGATILLNSHLLDETERICDRIGILVGGQLRLEGPLDEVLKGQERFAAQFEVHSERRIEAAGFSRQNAQWIFSGSVLQLNMALADLRQQGTLLTRLEPEKKTLEDVLALTMKGPS